MKKLLFLLLVASASVSTFAQEAKKEAVHIYDPKANAIADVNSAIALAKASKKHVLVQVGGNWCIWCIRFHDLVNATPELKSYLDKNFETVLVNYSPENKNPEFLKKYSYPSRFGFPVFLVIDGNGKLLHTQNSAYLEEGKGHSVKLISDFLKNWSYGALLPENNKL